MLPLIATEKKAVPLEQTRTATVSGCGPDTEEAGPRSPPTSLCGRSSEWYQAPAVLLLLVEEFNQTLAQVVEVKDLDV